MLMDCDTDGSYLAVFPLESWQGDISNIDDILVLFTLVGVALNNLPTTGYK